MQQAAYDSFLLLILSAFPPTLYSFFPFVSSPIPTSFPPFFPPPFFPHSNLHTSFFSFSTFHLSFHLHPPLLIAVLLIFVDFFIGVFFPQPQTLRESWQNITCGLGQNGKHHYLQKMTWTWWAALGGGQGCQGELRRLDEPRVKSWNSERGGGVMFSQLVIFFHCLCWSLPYVLFFLLLFILLFLFSTHPLALSHLLPPCPFSLRHLFTLNQTAGGAVSHWGVIRVLFPPQPPPSPAPQASCTVELRRSLRATI